jgi:8-oxo-dGTP pyrophosphatase MutT (NUDIX family)
MQQGGRQIFVPNVFWYHTHMAYTPYVVPVSVKGIVFEDVAVWLRKNERDEWELPGGKIEPGEQPTQTVVRELAEELGFTTEVAGIVQAHMYTVKSSDDEQHGVMVLTYLCKLMKKTGGFELVGEAGPAEFKAFPVDELADVRMPDFYKDAIREAFRRQDDFSTVL